MTEYEKIIQAWVYLINDLDYRYALIGNPPIQFFNKRNRMIMRRIDACLVDIRDFNDKLKIEPVKRLMKLWGQDMLHQLEAYQNEHSIAKSTRSDLE